MGFNMLKWLQINQMQKLLYLSVCPNLTSGTSVSYGVLMNSGVLSLTSDTRTMIGMLRFLRVARIVHEICNLQVNRIVYHWVILVAPRRTLCCNLPERRCDSDSPRHDPAAAATAAFSRSIWTWDCLSERPIRGRSLCWDRHKWATLGGSFAGLWLR